MKRIALAAAGLAVAVGAGYAARPAEFERYAGVAAEAGRRAWGGVEANPVPVAVALGTFLLTVGYHTAKGRTLRESVEVAATRVRVVPVPTTGGDAETAVVKRAKARATRTQLVADQIALENRLRKLPELVVKAEREACYTEQSVADGRRALADKQHAHAEAVAKLDALRTERDEGAAELAAIAGELDKLAGVV